MPEIVEKAQGGRPVRLEPIARQQPLPVDPLLPRRPLPVAPPGVARRSRLLAALVWALRLLFVLPVGRRARKDRLTGLSDRILRDVGMLRADAHAAAWGKVPLQQILPRYPGHGPIVVCARRRPLSLVRIREAA